MSLGLGLGLGLDFLTEKKCFTSSIEPKSLGLGLELGLGLGLGLASIEPMHACYLLPLCSLTLTLTLP